MHEDTTPAQTTTGGWRRVHPLTPFVRSWRTIAALLALLTVRSEDALRSFLNEDATGRTTRLTHLGTTTLLIVGGCALVALSLLLLLNWVAWRATSFRVTASSVEVRRGVVMTQHRHARLERVQAIDVVQPLVPRLLGLAELSFDVAGSGPHALRISMLKRADAESLRETIMARVRELDLRRTPDADPEGSHSTNNSNSTRGSSPAEAFDKRADESSNEARPRSSSRKHTSQAPRTVGARLVQALSQEGSAVADDLTATLTSTFAAYGAHPHVQDGGRIVHVPPHRTMLASLLRPSTLVAVIWLGVGIASVIAGTATGNDSAGWGIAVTTLLTALTFVHSTVQNALREANFSAALTPDGLLITQGVTSTERRLIPLDRIQAVGVEQPLSWRPFGWWRVHYNIAAQTASEDVGRSVNVLLPVGPLDDAVAMLSLALPTAPDGSAETQLTTDLLRDATHRGSNQLHGQPSISRWLDPLTWRVNGWARTRTITLIRHGRLRRRVHCIPHARIQSLALHAGPVQRRCGLASVSLHSTEGPVGTSIRHQRANDARELLFLLAEITRDAHRAERATATGSSIE